MAGKQENRSVMESIRWLATSNFLDNLLVTTNSNTMGLRWNEIRMGRGEEPDERRQARPQLWDAEQVFAGPCVTFEDDRFAYGEERLITLGLLAGRLVVIAHAPRDDGTRIISMRKGNRREQKIYQERLGAD